MKKTMIVVLTLATLSIANPSYANGGSKQGKPQAVAPLSWYQQWINWF